MRHFQRRSHDSAFRTVLRWVAALGFIGAGARHFQHPDFFRHIVPPGFPHPAFLVTASGVAEIVGGLGLLIRPLRRAAGWGLIVLLIAVFPANVYMAMSPDSIPDFHMAHGLLWARLPLQGVFIAWVYYIAIRRENRGRYANLRRRTR
jgi:uncharacterized membrane protein